MERKYGCETCDHCALCCKGWDIELTKEDIRSLAGLGYKLGDFLEIKGSKGSPIMKTAGKERNCIFLDAENMCVLEKRHGHEAKPHTCKLYPRIRAEALAGKDYFFYEYGGKTLSRDMLVRILETLKEVGAGDIFNVLLFRLEKLKKQKPKYVDVFNYDDRRRHSDLSKALARRRIRKLVFPKMREEDEKEISQIKIKKNFNVRKFIEHLQKGIIKEYPVNPNLPDMLLAYLYAMQKAQPRDEKALAEYFFKWNGKRF